jgi:hypothetical protein
VGDERPLGPVAEGEAVDAYVDMIGMHDEPHFLHGVLGYVCFYTRKFKTIGLDCSD